MRGEREKVSDYTGASRKDGGNHVMRIGILCEHDSLNLFERGRTNNNVNTE